MATNHPRPSISSSSSTTKRNPEADPAFEEEIRRLALERAKAYAQSQEVRNLEGLAHKIAVEDRAELEPQARRRIEHRDQGCATCGGSGVVEDYSPGAGTVTYPCSAGTDPDDYAEEEPA